MPGPSEPSLPVSGCDLAGYGGITSFAQTPPAESEQARAVRENWPSSYLLNSIFTHRCAQYAVQGVLNSFATDSAINALPNPNLILFSERNSEALNAQIIRNMARSPRTL